MCGIIGMIGRERFSVKGDLLRSLQRAVEAGSFMTTADLSNGLKTRSLETARRYGL